PHTEAATPQRVHHVLLRRWVAEREVCAVRDSWPARLFRASLALPPAGFLVCWTLFLRASIRLMTCVSSSAAGGATISLPATFASISSFRWLVCVSSYLEKSNSSDVEASMSCWASFSSCGFVFTLGTYSSSTLGERTWLL